MLYLFYLFIFGCVGSSLLCAGFSLVAVSGDDYSLRCAGFSLRWLLLLRSTGSRHADLSSCGSWALERRLSSCGTWALERRLSSCGSWALECRLSSCGSQALEHRLSSCGARV